MGIKGRKESLNKRESISPERDPAQINENGVQRVRLTQLLPLRDAHPHTIIHTRTLQKGI